VVSKTLTQYEKLIILTILLSLSLFSWTNLPPASKKLKKILSQNWAFVPSGSAKLGETIQNVEEFHIFKTETSNLDYLNFLESIKGKNSDQYKTALPDTAIWSTKMNFNQSYVNLYLRYPGFRQYPVVGVSHENAITYCKWLEENINSQLEGDTKVVVKLPSEIEWVRAARGKNLNTIYPWEGTDLQNKKGRSLANYKNEKGYSNTMSIITSEVREHINLNIPTLTWRNFPKVLNFREVEPQIRVFY
jgi:Sulfatase-modifying factor enzyme 1